MEQLGPFILVYLLYIKVNHFACFLDYPFTSCFSSKTRICDVSFFRCSGNFLGSGYNLFESLTSYVVITMRMVHSQSLLIIKGMNWLENAADIFLH
jgi:hypothetical protein